MKPKVIANYLPQYHEIPENSRWWGEGYTDWVAVKKARPLYKGHDQPRVPLNEHYYSLDDVEEIRWQAKLAEQYGIYGFGIYHYWFSDDLHLLDKPAFILKENADINVRFMFIWDNATWKRTWSNVKIANDWMPLYDESKGVDVNRVEDRQNGILAELRYGDESSWEKHFEYLLPFFKDERYIKIDNKPVFSFFNQNNEPEVIKKMCECWNRLAIKNGFSGIFFIGKKNNRGITIMEHEFAYNPEWDGWLWHSFYRRVLNKFRTKWFQLTKKPHKLSYDKVWRKILKTAKKNYRTKLYYCGFVSYDDTPRRGVRGKIICNASPDKFRNYFSELLKLSQQQGKEFVFLTAWNEWGEGAYLEPDKSDGFSYLESLKQAVDCIKEN